MKKLLIVIVILAVLAGGALGYALVNANAIAKRYKPDLERMASEALGTEVTLGDISASVFPSAKLTIVDARLQSGDEALTLDKLSLDVALLPLLRRDLQVREFAIIGPKITVYLEEDGVFIAGLPRESAEASVDATGAEPAPDAADAPITVTIETIALRNATIAIVDRVSDEQYIISDLDLTAAMDFADNVVTLRTLEGAMIVLEDVAVDFAGKNATIDLAGGAMRIAEATAEALGNRFTLAGGVDPGDPDESFRLTSDGLDLASLGPIYDVFAPGINDLGITGIARPDLTFAWSDDGRYRADGVIALADAAWSVAEIPLHDINGTLNITARPEGMGITTTDTRGVLREAPYTLQLESGVSGMQAGLEQLSVTIFDGAGTLNTDIQLEGDMPFTTKLDLSDMQLGQIVAALAPEVPVNITGTLKTLSGELEGVFNDTLMASITGDARMALVDGLVRDVNIGKEVLGNVSEIPFLEGTLLNAVPENLRALIQNDHTALESVTATFAVADEQLTTEDLRIESDFFRMDAQGTIGFDSTLDLDAVIYFTKSFSDGLAGAQDQLRVLFEQDGRLAFPVTITGVPPELSVTPDVSDLVKRAAQGAVREKAKDVLKDILGGDKSADPASGKKKKGGLLKRLGINP